jgi:hypothetical protein
MSARSRVLAAAGTAAALAALKGCQNPTPLVSLVSGGENVHSDATIYCFEGQSAQQQNCRTDVHPPTPLKVKIGQPVGFDVAKPVAKAGWVVVLPGSDQDPSNDEASGKQDGHYFAFTPQPGLFDNGPVRMEVRMLDDGRTDAPTVGNWQFLLVPS